MAFNIFHGGHELGQEVGVNRVVEVIKAENPDVIGMVEPTVQVLLLQMH